VTSENIVITPIQLNPSYSTILVGQQITFRGAGGYGAYTYSIDINATGGTINSVTGVYTAGALPGFDLIGVIDEFRNVSSAQVTAV